MLDANLIEAAEYAKKLVRKRKASDVVISVERTSENETKFVNNEPVKISADVTVGLTIFAVFDKKIVLTVAKELDKKKIGHTVNNLERFAKYILPKPKYFGIADGPFKYKPIKDNFDKKIPILNAAQQQDYVNTAVNAALEQGAVRTSGIFTIGHTDQYLTTSGNIEAKSENSSAYLSLRALVDKEASGHYTVASRMLKDFDVMRAGAAAGELARLSKNPEPGQSGKYNVIFSPLAFAPMLSITGESCSIFDVEAGLSFLGNKIGQQVANPQVTLHDYGNMPGAFGATAFDEEGVPTRKNLLIDNGVLKTYLYNTSFAKQYKTNTTANAGLISPSPWHISLEPGKLTKEKLFSTVKNGLYISNIWYTRFQNYTTGDFSTIPRDGMFIIKNGEFYKPVKHLRISDNMLKILRNISGIANDTRQVWSWELGENGVPVTLPHVLVKDVNITKPTA